ncbi:MAG: transposase [Actinomycetaceae bacterium]|nr:transposase [Actinomycetaceae bacterium]
MKSLTFIDVNVSTLLGLDRLCSSLMVRRMKCIGCARNWRQDMTGAAEGLSEVQPVLDAFRVVKLAGQAVGKTCQRIEQETLGRLGGCGDWLFANRKTLLRAAE